jgi:hypothetical protein
VERSPITISRDAAFAHVPNDASAFADGTGIASLVKALRDFRRRGAGPVVVIDLQDGRKWYLPNLYALSRLLEIEPVVSELVFTEMRDGIDGYLIGVCAPADLRAAIEQAVPVYAAAPAPVPNLAPDVDLGDAAQAQAVANAFTAFRNALQSVSPLTAPVPDDPVHGGVGSARIRAILGGRLSEASIDARVATLDEADMRVVCASRHRYVPATTAGRVEGLVDRDAVALVVARNAVANTGS